MSKIQGPDIISTERPVIIGQFGPPTLACIRSWGRQGLSVGMACIRSTHEPHPASKYLTDYVTLPPEKLLSDDGIRAIKEFLIKFHATGVICMAENIACWINDHRGILPNEVAVWLPSNKTIKDLISKVNQIETARKIGFNVLPTYIIDKNLETIGHIPKDHFPLCLRPTDPATIKPFFKAHLVYSHDELKKYIDSLMEINETIIAQPFKNLPNLVVHGARTIFGTSIGLQAFLVERKFETVTLTIRPTVLEKDLEKKCIEFTNHFDVTGNYHFEFLINKTNGFIYFLELNNRLGGTTAKVFACGYDEPLLALQSYGVLPTSPATSNQHPATSNKQPTSSIQQLKNITVSSKQALIKYLIYTIKGKLTPLDYPNEPKLNRITKTIYGFFRYRDDVFMLRDFRGSLALYLGNLKNTIPSR